MPTPAEFYKETQEQLIELITARIKNTDPVLEKKAKKLTQDTACTVCLTLPRKHYVGTHKVCDKCFERHSYVCTGCGVRKPTNDLVGRTKEPAKAVRMRIPTIQEVITRKHDPFEVKVFCHQCLTDKIKHWECNNCGCIYDERITDRKNGVCGYCIRDKERRLCVIHGHKDNILDFLAPFPAPKPIGNLAPLQFGVELEVQFPTPDPEMTGRDAEKTNATLERVALVRSVFPDFAICVHDGTILERRGHTGFEIVSVPATIDEHKREWPKLLDMPLKEHGMYSWKTGDCGMHVHITRAALDELQIAKMLVFLNNFDNSVFINKIAQRYSTKHSQFVNTKTLKDPVYVERNEVTRNRYEALNLTSKTTVEVRIFRGNFRKECFFKNLEFVGALVEFTRTTPTTKLSWTDFLNWLENERHAWPYLVKYLIKVKYLKDLDKPQTNKTYKVDYTQLEHYKKFQETEATLTFADM